MRRAISRDSQCHDCHEVDGPLNPAEIVEFAFRIIVTACKHVVFGKAELITIAIVWNGGQWACPTSSFGELCSDLQLDSSLTASRFTQLLGSPPLASMLMMATSTIQATASQMRKLMSHGLLSDRRPVCWTRMAMVE